MKIAVTRKLPQAGMDRLAEMGELWVWPHDCDMSRGDLLVEALDAEILIPQLTNEIDAEVMDARPNLKLLANYAVGFNNIDVKAAQERSITVANTPGVLTNSTAEITMALLLSASRRIAEGDRLVRRGEFKGMAPEFHLGVSLEGKTLGIYGMGRIGAAVARRARAFGMSIIYNNRHPNHYLEAELEAHFVTFKDLLKKSDFISINAPLTQDTHHRFSLQEFKLMKNTSVIVNTGRGPIINEKDLAVALETGEIAAAGLDVYENEPAVEPDLLKLENVVLSPHLGSATFDVRTRMAHLVADNVLAFIEGRIPPYKVA